MILRLNRVYYIKYENYHVDRTPFLYVLFSNAQETFGLNIHYLGGIFNPHYRYRWLNPKDTLKLLDRYRKHPALKKFFEFVENPTFARIPRNVKYQIIKKRWPKVVGKTFRHYKSRFIRVIWEDMKTDLPETIADVTNPSATRR